MRVGREKVNRFQTLRAEDQSAVRIADHPAIFSPLASKYSEMCLSDKGEAPAPNDEMHRIKVQELVEKGLVAIPETKRLIHR